MRIVTGTRSPTPAEAGEIASPESHHVWRGLHKRSRRPVTATGLSEWLGAEWLRIALASWT
jgi:hypothetical protein